MRDIVLVEKETGNSFEQVMQMPYIVYLCHLYWIQQLNFESYQDQLSLFGLGSTKDDRQVQHVTEPDMKKIQKIGGGL